ncbi:MAG: macro domain-containing protein [Pseudomonadota bacterium]
MNNIHIIEGNITIAQVDAIVNAANPMMLGGGGVDGAIHKAAGPELLLECRKVKAIDKIRCPFGEARITGAGQLRSKYVIHTAGPIYRTDPNPSKTLESCYINTLKLAIENDVQSIAFPAISCGAYGYPLEEAASIAKRICSKIAYDSMQIYFYIFGESDYEVWTRVFDES